MAENALGTFGTSVPVAVVVPVVAECQLTDRTIFVRICK